MILLIEGNVITTHHNFFSPKFVDRFGLRGTGNFISRLLHGKKKENNGLTDIALQIVVLKKTTMSKQRMLVGLGRATLLSSRRFYFTGVAVGRPSFRCVTRRNLYSLAIDNRK